MDDDEPVDSVRDKLMQGCDGSGVDGDDISGPAGATKHCTANNTTSTACGTGDGKKSPSSLDFKVDVSIPLSGSFAERRRRAMRSRRRLLVCTLVCLAVVMAIGIVAIVLMHGPSGATVAEYLGIPFAKPPLGELRYADPVPLEKLPSEPYDALSSQNSCILPIDTTYGDFPGTDMWNPKNPLSEDCLYLNVWTPSSASAYEHGQTPINVENNGRQKVGKAVMVWIYGGGFFAGSSSLWVYDGKALAAYGDVIVVSFNYRVGTFGYLSTGDGRIKGNFGMKDQVLALRWVRDNIASFGGDPAHVTLFGESSGASSAGLHQMSEWSRDLFVRVIYQSGSPDSHWSFMTRAQAQRRSKTFIDAVNCTAEDAAAVELPTVSEAADRLLGCLRRLDAMHILEKEWVQSDFMVFPWAPTVDGDFLIDTPYNMLVSGQFQRKESLLGVNRDEGTFWILFALPGFSKDGPSRQNLSMYLAGVDQIVWDLNDEQRKRIRELYLVDEGRDTDANRDALDKVCGDRSFTCPTKELTDIYSRRGVKTYFYYLTHRASNELWPPWMGVIHGADVQWAFGMPLNKSRQYTDEEIEFSKVIMNYWTNFAKTGDPNKPGSVDGESRYQVPPWPEYLFSNPRFLEMRGPSDFIVTESFRDEYCHVWRDINRQIQQAVAIEDARLT